MTNVYFEEAEVGETRKAGPYLDDDPELWKEIKAKGHAAIMAVGH